MLKSWGIKKEVVSLVFDTTSSNSSGEVGACFLLEEWVGLPVLWAACRHHVLELHIGKVVRAITGLTKDPGVKMFRRLRDQWHTLDIDYTNLTTFDSSNLPMWMKREAEEVLLWGQGHLQSSTFPRGDYKEFLQLVVI